jgi:hypothetical protein
MSMNLVDDDQSLVAYMCSKNMNLFQQHPILEWFDVFKMYNSGWPINKHNGVVEAYKNILGRNGDYGGLKNYIHSGHSLNDIKSIFLHSEEHKLLTKDVISVNGVNYDKYFVLSVCVDNTYLHKNRMDFFLNYLTGKKVLHIGFVDWPITDVNQNLHLSLAPHCNRLDGYDINYRNEVELTVPNGTNYSEWCQVSDDYDVIIVPEVIEHIGNLEDFLKQISTKHGKLIITTPDSVLLNNRYEQIDDEGNAFEVVHPDHNCVYTPYTLKTVINKYSNKKVQSLLWVNNHSIAAICE